MIKKTQQALLYISRGALVAEPIVREICKDAYHALKSLSLESVREEALEETCLTIQKAVSDYTRRTPPHLRDCDILTGHIVRALQHAPARVAEGETVAVMVEDEIWWLIETVDGKAFWAGAEECMWTNSALEAVRFRTKEIARGVAEHFLPTEPFALRDHRWSAWHPALSLMRTVKRVLESWANAYGEWSEQMPSRMANRLPPAGHVQLLEDITDALSESPAKEQPGEQNEN